MANVLHSFQDFQQALNSPTQGVFEQTASNLSKSYAEPEAPPTPAAPQPEPQAPPSEAPAGPSQPSQPAAAPSAPSQPADAGNLSQFSVSATPIQTSGPYAALFSPAASQLAAGQQQLQSTLGGFYEKAGPSRTFGEADQGILSKAIETGEGMTDAQKLLASTYGGPSSLDPTTLGALQNLIGQYQTLGKSWNSSAGVQNLVQQANQNLTAGEARAQARRLLGDETFRGAAQQYRSGFGTLASQAKQAQSEAEKYAAGRGAQEKAFGEAAKGYLTSRESDIDTALKGRLTELQSKEAARQAKLKQFQETGDADLAFQLEQELNPEKYQAYQDWQAKRDAILKNEKYASIAGVPELVARPEGEKGKGQLFEPDWYEQNKKAYSKKDLRAMEALAKERQSELSALGVAPETAYTMAQQQNRPEEAQAKYTEVMGKYADLGDIPLLEKTVSGHGRAKYSVINPKTGKPEIFNRSKLYTDEQKARILERQKEMETYFGDVIDPRAFGKQRGRKEVAKQGQGAVTPGEYSDVLNLYYGEGLTPTELPSASNYVTYAPGMEASEHNIATEAERTQHNRINQLLADADVLESVDPYAAGELRAQAAQYSEAAQTAAAPYEQGLQQQREDWLKKVKNVRRDYRDSSNFLTEGLEWLPGNLEDYALKYGPYAAALIGAPNLPGFVGARIADKYI